ncbi:hypothetical protein [Sorangium sp. So ce394]|uniref:hypothetical protein n=1 Tax=Sorangium sp. So ce394 TaxID=3133310 RepID=UPI003F5AFF9D
MQLAWKLLWTKGTPFYLPTIILNGLEDGRASLPPLAPRPVKDLGPIALFNKDPWGTVSISLSEATVAGLDTIHDQGFEFDSKTGAFNAKIGFDSLVLAGKYSVDGSGLAGCAVAAATVLLGLLPPRSSAAAADGSELDDEHIALARNYQAQLAQSPTGQQLVGAYYDNNDAMNEIVRGDTFFRHAFPTVVTDGKTSRDFADQTTVAAKSPNDPARSVGDPTYRLHAFKMQLAFARSAAKLWENTGDSKYLEVGKAKDEFYHQATHGPAQGTTTVGNVMEAIRNADPGAARALATQSHLALDPIYEAAEREIDEAHARWTAANVTRPYSELARAVASDLGQGTFSDAFGVPSLSLSGTIEIGGSGPNVTLTLTRLTTDIPEIDIALSTSLPDTLYDQVVQSLADAQFIKDLLRRSVENALGTKSTLDYLSTAVNAAIAKVLAP